MSIEFEELHRRLRLRSALFSCHEKVSNELKINLQNTIFADASIHYHAYLCKYPVTKQVMVDEPPELLDLFIDRIVKENTSILIHKADLKEEDQIGNLIKKVVKNLDKDDPFNFEQKYYKRSDIYSFWEAHSELGTIKCASNGFRLYSNWKNNKPKPEINYSPYYSQNCVEDIKAKLNNGDLTLQNKVTYLNLFISQYKNIILTKNKNDCLFFLSYPICSSETFYGILIMTIETPDGNAIWGKKKEEIIKVLSRFMQIIEHHSDNTYLPTLILTQNSWEEYILDSYLEKCLKENINPNINSELENVHYIYSKIAKKYIDDKKKFTSQDKSTSDIESRLIRLWTWRLKSTGEEWLQIDSLKKSLKFKKIMIASPGLISVVSKVVALNLTKPKEAPLPCVLIFAPPGAGKENISKIIPLFSENFWDKKIIPLNMGSIKSDFKNIHNVKDVFIEIYNKLESSDKAAVLVLDELNSLDIKEQPILLRILEQGEITNDVPDLIVDSGEDKEVPNWLVIGIINEDPEKLTLENLREQFSNDSLLGQILSVSLYEHFKVNSRLRDDLYYRIKRSGELMLQGLNDRREDIPIIFYFLLKKFLKEDMAEDEKLKEVFIPTETFRVLVDKSIDWKGNVRKLESVVRNTKSKIKKYKDADGIFILHKHILLEAITETIK